MQDKGLLWKIDACWHKDSGTGRSNPPEVWVQWVRKPLLSLSEFCFVGADSAHPDRLMCSPSLN